MNPQVVALVFAGAGAGGVARLLLNHWLNPLVAALPLGTLTANVLGSGAAEYEGMFAQLAGYHRDKMAAFLTYDADLAQLIYGGSDMFIMPSRFEPCGLGQLIAMRYGSVPVVRATGGLADTVQDSISGFTFNDYSAAAFWNALQRAIYIYTVDRPSWQTIQRAGLTADYSWQRSAGGYQQLYEWSLARVRGG